MNIMINRVAKELYEIQNKVSKNVNDKNFRIIKKEFKTLAKKFGNFSENLPNIIAKEALEKLQKKFQEWNKKKPLKECSEMPNKELLEIKLKKFEKAYENYANDKQIIQIRKIKKTFKNLIFDAFKKGETPESLKKKLNEDVSEKVRIDYWYKKYQKETSKNK